MYVCRWRGEVGGGGGGLQREEDGRMKSLEKNSSFLLISLVGVVLYLIFLGTPHPRPPSSESVIRPSWRGVKNIMWKGPPCEKRTFSTSAIPSLTPSSSVLLLQTSIPPLLLLKGNSRVCSHEGQGGSPFPGGAELT